MKRKSFLLGAMVLVLCGLGIGLAAYKHLRFGVPFLPGNTVKTWTVEARVSFRGNGEPILASLSLPDVARLEGSWQDVASSGYGYQELEDRDGRKGVWSARSRQGAQVLYYQMTVREEYLLENRSLKSAPVQSEKVEFSGAQAVKSAAKRLIDSCLERSADVNTFVSQLKSQLWGPEPSQDAGILKRSYSARFPESWEQALLMDILASEGVACRKAWGLLLQEGLGPQLPLNLVEYHDGKRWMIAEAESSRELGELVLWAAGKSLLDVEGGRDSEVYFNVSNNLAPLEVTEMLKDAPVWVGSVAALPLSERRVFRYIALIPVGAFIIVLLRNLVGLSTLGTFMPVLLSLSFLEIPLAPALLMFSLLLAAGLVFRFFLSRLNLLVVPRVAACVVIVTLLMIAFGLLSFRLGMMTGLKVTVFPMVVLAWTIERMSLLWDEEGPTAALGQAGGSLFAAISAYLVMAIREVNYWAQFFPELLLILLAGILLVGRYTGYRLSELVRFKSFGT